MVHTDWVALIAAWTQHFSNLLHWQRSIRLGLSVLIGAGGLAGVSRVAAAADAVALQPHRAVYDISLVEASDGLDLADLRGRMVVEWRGPGCPAYRVTQRILTVMNDREGGSFTRDMLLETRESMDGGTFDFHFRNFADGEINEQIKGQATRGLDSVQVTFDTPSGNSLRLPRDVRFPTQLTRELIQAGRGGQQVFQGKTFEGTEVDRFFDVTAYFSGRPASGQDLGIEVHGEDIGARLRDLESWPVSLSYFDVNAAEGLPDYEVSFTQFANGVAADLTMNYGDLVLFADLKQVDYFEPGDC